MPAARIRGIVFAVVCQCLSGRREGMMAIGCATGHAGINLPIAPPKARVRIFVLATIAGIWRAIVCPIKNVISHLQNPAQRSPSSPLKRWFLVTLQVAVTVGLLTFFFHDAEFRGQAAEAIRTANGSWLLWGILIAGVENLVGVVRWRLFLKILGIDLPFWKSVEICLVALFCNTFMLGAAGADLVRVAYLVQRGNRKTTSLLSIIMDRVSGLGALIVITLVLTAWNYDWLIQSPLASTVVKFVILYQLVALALLGVSLLIAVKEWTDRLPKWAPFRSLVVDLGSGYALLATKWRTTLLASLLSLFMLVAYFAVFYCSARAFGAPINYVQLSTIMPAADIISALPISVGGVGVREQVFVIMLGQLAGISAAMAVSISLTGFIVNCSWGIIGAVLVPLHFKGIIGRARREAKNATLPD